MSDVRCHVRDNVRDHGRDGELSNHRIPFIYAGFRRSMVGMLGLLSQSQLSQLFLKVPLTPTCLYYILYILLIINKL